MAILDAAGDEPSALRVASIAIYLRNEQWKELADILGRQLTIVGPDDDKRRARRAQVPARPAQGAAPRRRRRARSTRTATSSTSMPATPRARGALESPSARRRQAQADRRRASSSRSTSSSSEWAPLVGVHEIQLAAEKDSLRRTSLLLRIGELQRTKLLDAEKAFDAYARAFREDPSTEAAKDQLEALAALIEDGWAALVELFEGALAAKPGPRSDARARARDQGRAVATRTGSARATRRSSSSARRSSIEPDDLGALAALEAIFTRDEKFPELLEIYRRRVDIANEPDERLEFLFRIASIHEEMLSDARRGDRDLHRDPRPGAG